MVTLTGAAAFIVLVSTTLGVVSVVVVLFIVDVALLVGHHRLVLAAVLSKRSPNFNQLNSLTSLIN